MSSTNENVELLMSMGFPETDARLALELTKGDVNDALDRLTSGVPLDPVGSGDAAPPGDAPSAPGAGNDTVPGPLPASDADLDRAIAASLADASKSDDYDTEVAKAVEASLEDAKKVTSSYSDVPDPHSRKRTEGCPVGLKNVGNTCYFNSLMQAYFRIPDFVHAVFRTQLPEEVSEGEVSENSVPKPDDNDSSSTSAATSSAISQKRNLKMTRQLLIALQNLFGEMYHSTRSYVDPSEIMKNICDAEGKPVKIGDQEDAGEFHGLFLENLEAVLESEQVPCTPLSNCEGQFISQSENIVQRLFYGRAIEYLTAKEKDESLVSLTTEGIKFSMMHLTLRENTPDLHSSLFRAFKDDEVEYTTPKGHKTTASTLRWIDRVPSVLFFNVPRVQYDTEKQTLVRVEHPFDFQKQIYMDRYMHHLRVEMLERRSVEQRLRDHLDSQMKLLKSYENFNETGVSLDVSLTNASKHLSDVLDGSGLSQPVEVDRSTCSSALNLLSSLLHAIKNDVDGLQTDIQETRGQIEKMYEDLHDHPYELLAVLIHTGSALSGHYYSYMRNPNTDKWWKFNDRIVSEAEEKDVFEDGRGNSSSAAYCLVYGDPNRLSLSEIGVDIPLENLPASVQKFVNDDRAAFEEEKRVYDEEQRKRYLHRADSIQKDVKNRMDELEKGLKDPQDIRLKDFNAFLLSAGLVDILRCRLVEELYKKHFDKVIKDDQDSDNFKLIQEKFESEKFMFTEEDSAMLESTQRLYDQFCKSSQYFGRGLFDLSINPEKALHLLLSAARYGESLPSDELARTAQIRIFVCLAIQRVLTSASGYIDIKSEGVLRTLETVLSFGILLLHPEDPYLVHLRNYISKSVTEIQQVARSQEARDFASHILDIAANATKSEIPEPVIPFSARLETVQELPLLLSIRLSGIFDKCKNEKSIVDQITGEWIVPARVREVSSNECDQDSSTSLAESGEENQSKNEDETSVPPSVPEDTVISTHVEIDDDDDSTSRN